MKGGARGCSLTSGNLTSLTGRTEWKSDTMMGSKMHKKVGSETNPEAGSKANGDVSGTEYDEAYSKAETETESRLDGKMMNNLYDYRHQPTVAQCRHPRVLLIRIG